MDNDDINEKIEKLKEQLKDVLGEDVIIHGFSGKSLDEMASKVKDFMKTDILTITCNRTGINLEVDKCNIREVLDASISVITNVLQLFPKNIRNDMLLEAIQNVDTKYDEGGLWMNSDDDGEDKN